MWLWIWGMVAAAGVPATLEHPSVEEQVHALEAAAKLDPDAVEASWGLARFIGVPTSSDDLQSRIWRQLMRARSVSPSRRPWTAMLRGVVARLEQSPPETRAQAILQVDALRCLAASLVSQGEAVRAVWVLERARQTLRGHDVGAQNRFHVTRDLAFARASVDESSRVGVAAGLLAALKRLQQATDDQGVVESARLDVLEFYVRNREVQAAGAWVEAFHKGGTVRPNRFRLYGLIAELRLHEGRVDDAIQSHHRALQEVEAGSVHAASQWAALGGIHLANGSPEQAASALANTQAAVRPLPESHPLALLVGVLEAQVKSASVDDPGVALNQVQDLVGVLERNPVEFELELELNERILSVLREQRKIDDALGVYRTLLERLDKVWRRRLTNRVRRAFIDLLFIKGSYREAELQARWALAEDDVKPAQRRLMLTHLGRALHEQGRPLEAEASLVEALAQDGEGASELVHTLGLLTDVREAMGNLGGAVESQSRRVLLMEATSGIDSAELLVARARLAVVLAGVGSSDRARKVALEVEQGLLSEEVLPSVRSKTWQLLASAFELSGEHEAALQAWSTALMVERRYAETLDRPSRRLDVRTRLRLKRALSLLALGDVERAYRAFRRSEWRSYQARLVNRFWLRWSLLADARRVPIGEFEREHLRGLSAGLRIDMRDHRRALFVSLNQLDEREDAFNDYAAWLRYGHLRRRAAYRSLAVGLADAVPHSYDHWWMRNRQLSQLPERGVKQAHEQLWRVKQSKDRLLGETRLDKKLYLLPTPFDVSEALPDDTAVVEFVHRRVPLRGKRAGEMAGAVYTAFILTPDGGGVPEVVELGSSVGIERDLARYRERLNDGSTTSAIDAAGRRLRRRIWDPIGEKVDTSNVWVVADGPLTMVSFAALPASEGYLVESRRFRYLDLAEDVRSQRRPVSLDAAVVIGDIDYGDVTERPSPGSACLVAFPELPHSGDEVQGVADVLSKAYPLRTASGREATREWMESAVKGASVVHIASHRFMGRPSCRTSLDERNERVVGVDPLRLSGVALSTSIYDPEGVWMAEDIGRTPMRSTELVVVSATEPSPGPIDDGEGIRSLRRAFYMAGARASLMPLWTVDPETTDAINHVFYTAWLADPDRNVARALQMAQSALLRANLAEGDARPNQWGAFTVAGPR